AELRRFPALAGAGVARTPRPQVSATTRVLDSMARGGTDADPISRGLARMLAAARQTTLIESPYFVLTQDAAAMFEAAGKRGVAMTLLTNSPASTDNTLSQIYFREQWPRLLAKVPQLRIFASGTHHNIHSKFLTFDDQAVLLGSYNLDPFSMLVSGEIMVAGWSGEFAAQGGADPR